MNSQTEKQNQIQQISRMHTGNRKLHIASQFGGKPVIDNDEINVFGQEHRRLRQI